MLALTAASTSSAWNAGGSILTFYFPIGLFLVIGGLLWLQFGRQHATPGRKPLALARASASTAPPEQAAPDDQGAGPVSPASRNAAGPDDSGQPRPEPDMEEPEAPKAGG